MDEGGLVWDDWNERHLTGVRPDRAPVSRGEVDELYAFGRYVAVDYEHLNPEGEWEWQVRLIGTTRTGRKLTIACQIVERAGREGFRPVTAWDTSGEEALLYEKEFPDV